MHGDRQSLLNALAHPAPRQRPDNSLRSVLPGTHQLQHVSRHQPQRCPAAYQSWHARCLSWPFPVSHLNERRHNQLRFTSAARGDCCAGLIRPVSDAGAELPGDNRATTQARDSFRMV